MIFFIVFFCVSNFMVVNMFVGLPGGSDSKESACNAEDPGSSPGSGRSPGEGNPLQYPCLENSMEKSLAGLQSMESKRVRHD